MGGENEPRIACPELLGIGAHLGERLIAEVVDEHVGGSQKPVERVAARGAAGSIWTDFLPRLKSGKKGLPMPERWRVLSPSGGSTLITSAPRKPRNIPQEGPMIMWLISTTRMPRSGENGSASGSSFGVFRGLAQISTLQMAL